MQAENDEAWDEEAQGDNPRKKILKKKTRVIDNAIALPFRTSAEMIHHAFNAKVIVALSA